MQYLPQRVSRELHFATELSTCSFVGVSGVFDEKIFGLYQLQDGQLIVDEYFTSSTVEEAPGVPLRHEGTRYFTGTIDDFTSEVQTLVNNGYDPR